MPQFLWCTPENLPSRCKPQIKQLPASHPSHSRHILSADILNKRWTNLPELRKRKRKLTSCARRGRSLRRSADLAKLEGQKGPSEDWGRKRGHRFAWKLEWPPRHHCRRVITVLVDRPHPVSAQWWRAGAGPAVMSSLDPPVRALVSSPAGRWPRWVMSATLRLFVPAQTVVTAIRRRLYADAGIWLGGMRTCERVYLQNP